MSKHVLYHGQTSVVYHGGVSTKCIKQMQRITRQGQNKTVKVKFEGACSTCTVNQMTLKSGVEMIIKKHVPEIEKVISVEV